MKRCICVLTFVFSVAAIAGLVTPTILDVRDADTPGATSVLHVSGLTDGVRGFVDRGNTQNWINVPESLKGADYIQSAQNNADVSDDRGTSLLIEVDVAKGAVLYMFINERQPATPFPWMNVADFGADWLDTGLDISWTLNHEIFNIWRTVGPLDAGTYNFRQMPVDSSFYGIAATFTTVPVTIDIKSSQTGASAHRDINVELLEAAQTGNTAKVKQLLREGADVNAQDKYGRPAWMIARAFGHTETVNILKQAGAQSGASAHRNINAELLKAAEAGNTAEVEQLLKQGANANAANPYGKTALMDAAAGGHTETVKALLDAGANVNEQYVGSRDNVHGNKKYGDTALITAAGGGHNETVKFLLAAGADLKAQDWNYRTAMMVAIIKGNTETVKALIDAGADVNTKDVTGMSALMASVFMNQTDTAKALIDAGVDVDAKDKSNQTALLFAAGRGRTETLKALIEAGADLNAKIGDGRTGLMGAAANGHTENVIVLVEAGADVNAESKNGDTALMFATERHRTEIVEILRRAGARQ